MQKYVMGYIETVTLSETAMLVCVMRKALLALRRTEFLKLAAARDVIRGDFFI